MTRVVVTGGTGFLGRAVVAALRQAAYDVVVVTRDPTRAPDGVTATTATPPWDIDRADVLVHLACAGVVGWQGGAADLVDGNVALTTTALTEAVRLGCTHVVGAGSSVEYGAGSALTEDAPLCPSGLYATGKAASGVVAAGIARTHRIGLTWLRPFTVYGPGEAPQRLSAQVFAAARDGVPLDLTEGRQERDFVYVADAAAAFAAAVAEPTADVRALNVCSGAATTVRVFAETAAAATGRPVELRFGALPYRDDEVWASYGDPARAKNELGWRAGTPLDEGLKLAWEAFA